MSEKEQMELLQLLKQLFDKDQFGQTAYDTLKTIDFGKLREAEEYFSLLQSKVQEAKMWLEKIEEEKYRLR